MKRSIILLFLITGLSCASIRPSPSQKNDYWDLSSLSDEETKMANELLSWGLEHEALYTLLDTLKPISSLGYSLSYPIAKDSLMSDGDKSVVNLKADSIQTMLYEIERWNNVVSSLSNDELTFLLLPYKRPWNGKRNMQLLVVRNSVFTKLLKRKAEFFGQWGFTPNADPATVLTTIEFESRNDRYRAYGYLFGYPEHAVDFFVEASISEENTGEFVTRDFFSMPVSVGTQGYFTYAIPKGYIPTGIDSVIYNKAEGTLNNYKSIKENFINDKGELNAVLLINSYRNDLKTNQ